MDVTPRELRGTEIKEAWRGFNRDEVDDLLERAAATIENLTRRIQELESRAPADPHAVPTSRDDAEMLQRTLLLAQRAADDAVAEAQARARQLVDEAETRAQALVTEAETTARRIAEGERRRLEDEIRELARRRDILVADADALDSYVTGYRHRLRAAIEADLERLSSTGAVDPPLARPELHDVPVPLARDAADDRPSSRPQASPEIEQIDEHGVGARALDASRPGGDWPPPAPSEPPPGATVAAPLAADATAPSPSWLADEPAAPHGEASPDAPSSLPSSWERPTAEHEPFSADTPIEAHAVETDDDLDDDAFFASLREAVRDDAPLGPRDEHSPFFEGPVEERRGHFRRRR